MSLRRRVPIVASTVAALLAAPAAAQASGPFPVTETFSHSTLGPGWNLVDSASLTAGQDGEGEGWSG